MTQYGYENLFVLEGGLDGWKSVVDNKDIFKGKYPKDEDARVDFAKAAKPDGEKDSEKK